MISHPFSQTNSRIRTSEKSLYDKFCDELKMFEQKHHLFTFSLVYGLLHNEISTKQATDEFVTLSSIMDKNTKFTVDVIAYILDDGNKDDKQMIKEIIEYADGGLKKMDEIFIKNHDTFNMPSLIADSEELWKDRITSFNNINLD